MTRSRSVRLSSGTFFELLGNGSFFCYAFFSLFFVATERLGRKAEPFGGKSDTKKEESVEEKRYMETHWLVIHFD